MCKKLIMTRVHNSCGFKRGLSCCQKKKKKEDCLTISDFFSTSNVNEKRNANNKNVHNLPYQTKTVMHAITQHQFIKQCAQKFVFCLKYIIMNGINHCSISESPRSLCMWLPYLSGESRGACKSGRGNKSLRRKASTPFKQQ